MTAKYPLPLHAADFAKINSCVIIIIVYFVITCFTYSYGNIKSVHAC